MLTSFQDAVPEFVKRRNAFISIGCGRRPRQVLRGLCDKGCDANTLRQKSLLNERVCPRGSRAFPSTVSCGFFSSSASAARRDFLHTHSLQQARQREARPLRPAFLEE